MYKVFLMFQRTSPLYLPLPLLSIILFWPMPSHLHSKPQPSAEVFYVLEHLDPGLISILKDTGHFQFQLGENGDLLGRIGRICLQDIFRTSG